MNYKNIFKKGNIGNIKLKNRTVFPAISTCLADENGYATDDLIKFYEKRAKAGSALIISEKTRIDDETGITSLKELRATNTKYIDSLNKLSDAVHKYDSKIFLQLNHPGRQTSKKLLNGKNIIAPSPIASTIIGETPDEMTIRQIQVLINRFTIGAKIAQDANMDGVEINGAHGHLISQFISPNTNKRNDKYGGNIYNNLNFLKEIIEGIRQFCGDNFPISVRINGKDFIKGGLSKEDAIESARILSSFPIDVLNISSGTYESMDTIVEPASYKEAWKKDLSQDIKKSINLPIIACNNIKTPKTADNLLENDICDFIGLGRSQLADPEFIKKTKLNKTQDINSCKSCLHCLKTIKKGEPIKCAINI